MSKFNFSQCFTEITKSGFVVTLTQTPVSQTVFNWEAAVINEKGAEFTERDELPLVALNKVVNAIHATALHEPPEDDCSDLV